MSSQENEALNELLEQFDKLTGIIDELYKLKRDNMFRYLSKNARNTLLTGLMESSGAVEDAAKATYRAIKKVKRERLPEEVADLLLVGNRNEAIAFAPVVINNESQVASSFPSD
jgi:hypothetical protein